MSLSWVRRCGGGVGGKETFAFGLVLSGEVEDHARDVLADTSNTN